MIRPNSRFNRRGSTIMAVIILDVALAFILASVLSYITTSSRLERRSNNRMRALYAAEYAVEQNYSLLSNWLRTNRPLIPDVSQTTAISNLSTAPTTEFPSSAGYQFDANLIVPIENGLPVDAHGSVSHSTETYRFLSIASVSVNSPASGPPAKVGLQEEITYTLTPIFKFAMLYDGDLELFPGADFTVGGRVHSNGKFYHGTNATLTFQSFVTSHEGALTTHHPNDPRSSAHTGPIVYNGGVPFITPIEHPPATILDPSNPNAHGPRELIEIPTTDPDPNRDDRMYVRAGLKVLVNSTASAQISPNSISIPANGRVYLTADGTEIPSGDPLAAVLDPVFLSGQIKDYRENFPAGGTMVTTVDVQVDRLTDRVDDGRIPEVIPNATHWPATAPSELANQPIPAALRGKQLWNGQLYVADITNSSSHRVGVRLRSGEVLPNEGLTVTTENAAYIEGNYNTGGTPPVNGLLSSLTAANTVSGYYRPAAVLADAVSIVSSNWNLLNYNSQSTLTLRLPTATTVNTAIVSGIVPTSSTAYSGGAENFLRMLENWSGVRLTYYGSLVNLFESRQSTSIWRDTGNYYNAPRRNWYFDTNFYNPNKLPKGTPVTRRLSRGQWMQVDNPM